MSDHLIAEANRHAKALSKMTLPTTKPNDRDLDWYVRECESLDERNKELERENAALMKDKERLDWLSSQKDQPWLYWERPLRLTREAIDAARKEAQP